MTCILFMKDHLLRKRFMFYTCTKHTHNLHNNGEKLLFDTFRPKLLFVLTKPENCRSILLGIDRKCKHFLHLTILTAGIKLHLEPCKEHVSLPTFFVEKNMKVYFSSTKGYMPEKKMKVYSSSTKGYMPTECTFIHKLKEHSVPFKTL